MKLFGKKALATGSNQGIGQAIGIRLAEEGADVVIDYVTHPETAEETAQSISRLGRKAVVIRGDLSKVAGAQQLVHQSVEAFGELDILVNNAGIERNASFWEVTEADYDLVLNIAPGAIETPINTKLLNDPDKLKALLENIPLARLGGSNNVAGVAAFLASADANYVTGATSSMAV
jgi:NAD(P)-dependent dehydrogenase (short-subunit alcohol dehydrogenase family)